MIVQAINAALEFYRNLILDNRSIINSIFIIVIFIAFYLPFRTSSRHARKIRKSQYTLKKIEGFSEAQKIAYLRKVDPYTFEELILTCLERKGFPIIRNKKYSGDGGIDGKFVSSNEIHLIQAKRYKNEIKYNHLVEFASILEREKCKGIFVHTGRTPKNISLRGIDMSNITIISGSRLIKLLNTEIKLQY